MAPTESIKRPLRDWLDEFYDNTSTLSGLVRNLALAGIGIIWIFRNSDLSHDILPKTLVLPLTYIVLGLVADLAQYLWKAILIYGIYKYYDIRYVMKKITDKDIADVTMPDFIAVGSWLLFFAKIVLVTMGYVKIYLFLQGKL